MGFVTLWFRYVTVQIICSVLDAAENTSLVGKLLASESECSDVWRILHRKSAITSNVHEEWWCYFTGEDERKQVNKYSNRKKLHRLCRSSSINLLLLFACSVIYTRKHHILSVNHARNVPGPCSLSSCQSQQILQIFLLLSFKLIPHCPYLPGMRVMRNELWSHWCTTWGRWFWFFFLLLVTWGHSLNYYLPGKLFLWVFSSSLDFWAIMPKHLNLHFLRLNSNFIYCLCFYAQRKLFRILCTVQRGMFLVTEHLSSESISKRYPNVQQVSLTKE